MTKKEFENLKVAFTSDMDPILEKSIDISATHNDFNKVESGFGIFKLAANQRRGSINEIETSTKYQVLMKSTAMVGVVRLKEKPSGESQQVQIEFGRKVNANVTVRDPYQQQYN